MKRRNRSTKPDAPHALFPEALDIYLAALLEAGYTTCKVEGRGGPLIRLSRGGDDYALEIIAADTVRLGVMLRAAIVENVEAVALLAISIMSVTPFVRIFTDADGEDIYFVTEGIVTSTSHLLRCVNIWLEVLDEARSLFKVTVSSISSTPGKRSRRATRGIERDVKIDDAAPTVDARVCRLKIRLRDVKPSVWRRVEVPLDITFARLHRVVQAAMGWNDTHLHLFRVERREIGMPSRDDFAIPCEDERKVRLGEVARPKLKIVYWYDFGDDWMHDIIVESMSGRDPAARYPRLLDGANAGPPEDVGGPGGYEEFLAALADPKHGEHESFRTWIGGTFDPRAYDRDERSRAVEKVR